MLSNVPNKSKTAFQNKRKKIKWETYELNPIKVTLEK